MSFNVVEFEYKGERRVAVELGPDTRGNSCMLCRQIVPEVGIRSFKVAKRMDLKHVGFWKSLYYLGRAKVGV